MADQTTTTYTAAELAAMEPEKLQQLLLRASEVTATAVVRDADGNVKYDDPAQAGEFGEQYLTGASHGHSGSHGAGEL